MDPTSLWQAVARWFAARPTHSKVLLALAVSVLAVELVLRRFAPSSAAYRRWKAFFEKVGSVWTAVLLSIIYVLSVGPISLALRLLRKDPLDRGLRPEPSFWREHEPNPLGPLRAARHQF